MKIKILMPTLLVMALGLVSCEKNEMPSAKVLTAFDEKFPTATKVKWDKETKAEWETEFTMSGKSYSANFTNEGEWKETEYALEKDEIPTGIMNVINRDFKDYKMEISEVSKTVEGTKYEFVLELKEVTREVVISENGSIISNTVSKEKAEKDTKDED